MKKFYILLSLLLISVFVIAQEPQRPVSKKEKKTAIQQTEEKVAKPDKQSKEKANKEVPVAEKPSKSAEKVVPEKEPKKEFVMPTGYDKVGKPHEYKENWCLVKKNGKYGFTGADGKEVVPPQYDEIKHFGDYRKDWALVTVNGRLGFISSAGKEVVAPKYDKM